MDERELTELFRDAPGEPPPPTFTASDVAATSRRATARRRTAITGAAAAVVLLGGSAGILGVALPDRQEGGSSATAVRGQSAPGEGGQEQPGRSPGRLPSAEGFPQASPKQGGEPGGETGPRAGSTSGCDKVDRELAIALAGELPVTADEATPDGVCPEGTRFAAFPLEGGTISAVLVPRGVALQLPERPEGTASAERQTRNGATVMVISTPASGSADAPFAADLDRIAAALAREF